MWLGSRDDAVSTKHKRHRCFLEADEEVLLEVN
jgi:hypothetical protein